MIVEKKGGVPLTGKGREVCSIVEHRIKRRNKKKVRKRRKKGRAEYRVDK